MKLLALDTSSARCSVALLHGDALVVREAATARDHAQLVLPMIDEVLGEAGMSLRQLDGIALGRGPGSFTGVRIAAAVAQGLALGADLPVFPVSTLRALAHQALRAMQSSPMLEERASIRQVLACMDARMGEVYWAVYAADAAALPALTPERVTAPDVLVADCPRPCSAGAGRGFAAWPDIAGMLQLPAQAVLEGAEPHALDVAQLAATDLAAGEHWQDAAGAQPVYVRNQVVSTKFHA